MAIAPGSRVGVYEVSSQLGQGAMGVVYRARDRKLLRDVALKVLPEHFASAAPIDFLLGRLGATPPFPTYDFVRDMDL